MALLELDHVTKRFGRVVIAEDLSFTVDAGETVGIVGPNGAGKTSLFGLISGDLTPGAGQVNFAGRNITRLDSAARARLGVGRTYQVPRPFTDMTVFENVLVAAQQGGGQRRKASYAAAAAALERTGIAVEANTPACRLGLLARKRLEIARALATGPSLLLLDEVAGGLTDPEVTVLVEIVRAVNAEGIAVIWIEHVVRALTSLVVPDDVPVRRGVHRRRHPGRGARQPPGARDLLRRRPRPVGRRAARRAGKERSKTMSEPNGPGLRAAGPLLEVRDLVVHHGQLKALSGISLAVYPGEVYAIIGANGAGKSTLLRTIAGLHHPTEGTISYEGRDITRVRPEKRATAGIGMVPEGRRLFPSLSLEENLKVGATYARKGPWTIERVFELFPWMKDRRGQKTAQMSGGEQQSVAIGRALVANPQVLLLDELSLGLAPVIVQRIYAMLPQVLESGVTVLLVEQDVSQALRVATHLQCMLEGHTTLEGTPAEVTRDQVEAAYFGVTDGSNP